MLLSNFHGIELSSPNIASSAQLSKPQHNLNTRLGLTIKWLCTPTTETQCQQYLSCYWPDFDETLKVGRFLWTFRTDSNCQGDICSRNICPHDTCPYQEYLSCYWWNFKCSFLEISRTDSNYQVDICLGKICPWDICPYQEYWPDVDQTLKVGSCNHF